MALTELPENWPEEVRRHTTGVAADPWKDGVFFHGPGRRMAWSPDGSLSAALGFAARHEVAAHPWDPWPNPKKKKKQSRATRSPARNADERTASARPRRMHV